MKLLEVKGFDSYWAMVAYHHLMLGLKMLPAYMAESYEAFYSRIEVMSDADKEKMVREAALFVKLDKEEIEAMMKFVTDSNGIPYDKTNIGNLKPNQIMEAVCLVAIEISKIKIDFVTEAEKKNSKILA